MNSPLFFERYELKFLVPGAMIEDIKSFIEPYCQLDPFCKASSDNYYRINSLYLDSLDGLFYRKRQASVDGRFNMRIRTYGANPTPPYFLEVKYKTGGYVKKYRAKVSSSDFENAVFGMEQGDKNHKLFTKLATIHHVEPKVMTSYKRMAFFSQIDEYARVTFDRNMKCHEARGFYPVPSLESESNYDNETLFPPNCDTVLELKSTTNVPLWMVDLIRYFRLERTSFSKYCNSYQHVYGELASRQPNDIVALGGK